MFLIIYLILILNEEKFDMVDCFILSDPICFVCSVCIFWNIPRGDSQISDFQQISDKP